jgi:hypothetical protein
MARLQRVLKKPGYLFLLWCLVSSNVETLLAQQTNTFFLIQEMTKVIRESPLSAHTTRPISLNIDAPDPVVSLLQQSLIDRGFRLFNPGKQDTLLYKVMISPNLTMTFSGKKKDKGQRSLKGFVVATVLDHRDQIVETYSLPVQVKDTLFLKQEQFEDELWTVSRFSTSDKQGNRWKSILEPAVIISAVTTSIYLLFNVRSR